MSLLFDAVPAPATRNTGYDSGCVLQFVNSNIFLHSILNTKKKESLLFLPNNIQVTENNWLDMRWSGSSSRLIFRLPEIKIQQQKNSDQKVFRAQATGGSTTVSMGYTQNVPVYFNFVA